MRSLFANLYRNAFSGFGLVSNAHFHFLLTPPSCSGKCIGLSCQNIMNLNGIKLEFREYTNEKPEVSEYHFSNICIVSNLTWNDNIPILFKAFLSLFTCPGALLLFTLWKFQDYLCNALTCSGMENDKWDLKNSRYVLSWAKPSWANRSRSVIMQRKWENELRQMNLLCMLYI